MMLNIKVLKEWRFDLPWEGFVLIIKYKMLRKIIRFVIFFLSRFFPMDALISPFPGPFFFIKESVKYPGNTKEDKFSKLYTSVV